MYQDPRQLPSNLRNMWRMGTVVDRDPSTGRVKVCFPDRGGCTTNWIPYLTPHAGANKVYNLPDLGVKAFVFLDPTGQENGCVLGAGFSPGVNGVPPTLMSPNSIHTLLADGSFEDKNPDNSTFTTNTKGPINVVTVGPYLVTSTQPININTSGTCNITSQGNTTIQSTGGNVTIQGSTINLVGNVAITGNLSTTGSPTFGESGVITGHLTNSDGDGGGS
jgi:phage baseplate assembly protein V